MALAGEWQFAWKSLLTPADSTGSTDAAGTRTRSSWTTIQVPGSWGASGSAYPAEGFGTYRLLVQLPPGSDQTIGLELKGVGTAYRLYCNGKLVLENGVVSSALSDVRGSYTPRVVSVSAAPRLEIVLQVSNAEDTVAGLEEARRSASNPSWRRRIHARRCATPSCTRQFS